MACVESVPFVTSCFQCTSVTVSDKWGRGGRVRVYFASSCRRSVFGRTVQSNIFKGVSSEVGHDSLLPVSVR